MPALAIRSFVYWLELKDADRLWTMTGTGGDVYSVSLRATIAELHGSMGIEDQEIARIELIDQIPDGNYILEYFYLKPFHGQVRVVNGSLLSVGC